MIVLRHLFVTAVFVNMAFSYENVILRKTFPKSAVNFIFFVNEKVFRIT